MQYFMDYDPFFEHDGKIKGYTLTARVPNALPVNGKAIVEETMLKEAIEFLKPNEVIKSYSQESPDVAGMVIFINHKGSAPSTNISKVIDVVSE